MTKHFLKEQEIPSLCDIPEKGEPQPNDCENPQICKLVIILNKSVSY
jgi:hypothetical protein